MPSDVGADAAADDPRWRIPFWALQVLEFGTAFLLVTQSVHVVHGALLVAAGAVLVGLALTADGPLGVYRVCGRRLHRLLVLTFAGALAVACIVPALRPDIEGLLLIGFAVVALAVLALRTTVSGGRGGRRRRRRATGGGEVIDATATVTTPEPAPAPAPRPPSTRRPAGRGAPRRPPPRPAVGPSTTTDPGSRNR